MNLTCWRAESEDGLHEGPGLLRPSPSPTGWWRDDQAGQGGIAQAGEGIVAVMTAGAIAPHQHRPPRQRRLVLAPSRGTRQEGRSSSHKDLPAPPARSSRPDDRVRRSHSWKLCERYLNVHTLPSFEVQHRASHIPDNHQPAAEAEVKSAGPCLYALYGTSRLCHPKVPSPADFDVGAPLIFTGAPASHTVSHITHRPRLQNWRLLRPNLPPTFSWPGSTPTASLIGTRCRVI